MGNTFVVSKRYIVIGALLLLSSFGFSLTCDEVIHRNRTLLEENLKESRVKFKTIANPHESLAATLQLIRSAKHSLDLSTFIIRPDQVGQIIIHELKLAAERGVSIRLLVDSMGSLIAAHGDIKVLLPFPNVQVATFNSLTKWGRYPGSFFNWLKEKFGFPFKDRSSDKFFLNRLHDKIVISDIGRPEMLILVGGRNWAETYFGIGKSKNSPLTFLDLNVLIRPQENESPQLGHYLNYYFESLFYHSTNQLLINPKFGLFSSSRRHERRLHQALENNRWLEESLQAMNKNHFLDTDLQSASLKLVHELQNITRTGQLFNFNTYNWKKPVNKNSVTRTLREAIKSAKKSVSIVTPYLILSEKDIQQLYQSLVDNPDLSFEFMTNSFDSTNQKASQLIFEAVILPKLREIQKDPKVGDRLKVYLYKPNINGPLSREIIEGRLHTKLVITDDMILVTSSNFDLISRFSNSELGFWLKPDATNTDVMSYLQRLREDSILVGSEHWKSHENSPRMQAWVSLKRYLATFLQRFHIRLLKILN